VELCEIMLQHCSLQTQKAERLAAKVLKFFTNDIKYQRTAYS
jgi:hypothetical protein